MSHEYEIDESEFLVLLADKASQFLYANDAYLKVSGYSWDELQGTITARMLHKDTPLQVQHDMTRTVRAKQPWTGIIKNQRKNGDYYWVRLNFAPLFSQGAFAGSLLVHSKATHEEIARHEAMYRRMRDDKSLMLSNGEAVRDNFLGRALDRIRNRGLSTRLWLSMSVIDLVGLIGLLAIAGSTPATWFGWVTLAACTTLLGAHLSRSIVAPLREALRLANRVAAGDLGTQGNSARPDEIGALIRAVTQMSMNMRATVLDVRQSVYQMKEATGEIATGTQELSGRTENQASHLERTATSIGEINATVQQTADAARQASQFSKSACDAADSGGQVVDHVVSTMQGITQSSKKIAEIIGVIDSIAFQTNILALNAAVEAARAGEHGRGFAVVAGEVRNLAQRSARSVREIKTLISESVEQVHRGSSLVNDAGKTIGNVVTQVRRVTELVGHIADATVEQANGVGEISQGVTQLDHMTQQNAALVQDSTSFAESLRAQAERLAQAVAVFKLSERENRELFNSTKISAAEGTARSIQIRAA